MQQQQQQEQQQAPSDSLSTTSQGREDVSPDNVEKTHFRDINEAYERATTTYQFCRNRIAMLAEILPDEENSLPQIFPPNDTAMETMLHKYAGSAVFDTEHQDCVADLCEKSQMNSTSIQQRHELGLCAKTPCARSPDNLFPTNFLDEAAQSDRPTAWQLNGRRLVLEGQDFMAISHVWSDGTGVGSTAGNVNTCLFNFFRDFARKLDCHGLWWDVLCLPTDRTARARAVSNMHVNYSRAAVTLVHDCFLRQIEWVDAEMACMAIILSPWFGRGWTALELAKSKRVSVIFKKANGLVLKDLDNDILARPSTPRHRVLADTINYLRKDVDDVDQLLRILRPRHTSISRDKTIIASLLADVTSFITQIGTATEVSATTQQQIFMEVLQSIGTIGHENIFHNLPRMQQGRSWCPAELLKMPIGSAESKLHIDENGNVTGTWNFLQIESLPPASTIALEGIDGAGAARGLRSAMFAARRDSLQRPCLIFQSTNADLERAVLVELHREMSDDRFVEFISTVRLQLPIDIVKRHSSNVRVTILNNPEDKRTWGSSMNMRGQNTAASQPRIAPPSLVSTEHRTVEAIKPKYKKKNPWSLGHEQMLPDKYKQTLFSKAVHKRDAQQAKNLLDNYEHQRYTIGYTNKLDPALLKKFRSDCKPNAGSRWSQHDQSVLYHAQFDFPDSSGQTPLILAAMNGDSEIVSLLTTFYETQIDHQDGEGMTALLWATQKQHWEAATVLITAGARFDHIEGAPRSPLSWAAQHGHIPTLKLLLSLKDKSWSRDGSSRSAITYAAENGHQDAVHILLEHETNHRRDGGQSDALIHAAKNGFVSIVQQLLGHGVDPSSQDEQNRTALSYAAENGDQTLVQVLLDTHWRDMGKFLKEVRSALLKAVNNGHVGIVQIMVDKKEFKDYQAEFARGLPPAAERGDIRMFKTLLDAFQRKAMIYWNERHIFEALMVAASSGHDPIVEMIIDNGADEDVPRSLFDRPLLYAAKSGHFRTVQLLIEKGADVKTSIEDKELSKTPLAFAAEEGHERVVDLLLEKEASAGEIEFCCAVAGGNATIVMKLLDAGADPSAVYSFSPDKNRWTPVFTAVYHGHEAVVKLLISRGVKFDLEDEHGRTPLSYAAEEGDLAVAKLLLGKGARIEPKSFFAVSGHLTPFQMLKRSRTSRPGHINHPDSTWVEKYDAMPLSYAAMSGNGPLVQLLLDYKPKINSRNVRGRTPLFYAAINNHGTAAQLLLSKGAAVDEMDNKNRTPLSCAAENDATVVVPVLLRYGARIDSIDDQWQTPLSWASRKGLEHMVKLLLDAGANIAQPDHTGCTPVYYAVRECHINVVKILLDKEAISTDNLDYYKKLLGVYSRNDDSHKRRAIQELLEESIRQYSTRRRSRR